MTSEPKERIDGCPICGRPVAETLETSPFCSSRCRLVDLGRWFEGRYAIGPPSEPHEGEGGGEGRGGGEQGHDGRRGGRERW